MSEAFRLQDPGEGIQEAEIVTLHIKPGQAVKEDDILLEMETDKAMVDLPSPFTGTIEEVRVKAGERVNVGDVLFTYTSAADAIPAEAKTEKPQQPQSQSPAVAQVQQTATFNEADSVSPARHAPPVQAAPATRRLARELNVPLEQVSPSGPHGRVTAEDVRAFAAHGMGGEKEEVVEPVLQGVANAEEGVTDTDSWGEIEIQPLRGLRRKVAEHMSESWQQIPHVNHQILVDITELEALRQRHKEEVKAAGGHLTLTVFAIKAVVSALKRYPRFNASLDASQENLLIKRYYHIGVAVDTDNGLLVPVIHNADRKDMVELAIELEGLAVRARAGELKLEEMRGGSFTITNPGMLGGDSFSPLIHYPEAGILGMAQAKLTPVVQGTLDDYTIVPRLMMPLCLAFDHRINDGADAARFTNAIVEELTDPEQLLLKG